MTALTPDTQVIRYPEVLVYLAGPFSGENDATIDQNIAAMVDLALAVTIQVGCMIVVPHANTGDRRYRRIHDYPFWIAGTLELMRRCDAVFLHTNWERSSGASGEVREAERIGIPVFDDLTQLEHWIGGDSARDFMNITVEGRRPHGTPAFHELEQAVKEWWAARLSLADVKIGHSQHPRITVVRARVDAATSALAMTAERFFAR